MSPIGAPGLHRKPVYAPHGAVATSQPLAVSAGLNVLRRGGNAVDAALAAAITLTVVQPTSNDIGGDLFAMVWDGDRLHGLNASGRSPAALTRSRVAEMPSDGRPGGLPERGWLPVTVPGAPAGWRDLHERFGRAPFDWLFEDAIALAEHGFPVSPAVAHHWQRAVPVWAAQTGPEFAAWPGVFAPGGRVPEVGQTWRNPDAARTLGLIASTRAEAFYTGEVAQAIAELSARTGGLIGFDDLAQHSSLWVEPISVSYRGYEVWELPPNGQGLAALLALALLDGIDLAGAPAELRVHTQIEAMKLGFADAWAWVADPELAPAPVTELLAPDYVRLRRSLIGDKATVPAAGEPARGGTVYLCTADAQGMMVSLIQSNYQGFGSFVVVPGYGFGLQNRGCGFSLDEASPNVVGPAKRPYHTIIPGFLSRQGLPVGPFGVMGAHMQPQGHVQLVMATIDGATVDGQMDPQAALDAPRWYWSEGLHVQIEPELGEPLLGRLRQRGHEVSVAVDRSVVGHGQAIWRLPAPAGVGGGPAGSGLGRGAGYVAGSESRADGHAAGY